ncbi:MAG: SLC13 family permease [Phycisphaerales bacterium]
MTPQAIFVTALLAVAAVLMASNRVRLDIVALLILLALMLAGILPVGDALAGFGSPVVITVAALLVVGEMLDRTGVTHAVGDFILKKGGRREPILLILIMSTAALLGSVMSSTAVVAVFIPIVLRITAETRTGAGRLLLPMSYAALISGMLTLISSTRNIVVHEELRNAGANGFAFFGFAPVGVAVFIVAVAYILIAGRWLLPRREPPETRDRVEPSLQQLVEDFGIDERTAFLRVPPESPLTGRSIDETAIGREFGARVLGLLRPRRRGADRIIAPPGTIELQAGDTLLIIAPEHGRRRLTEELNLEPIEPSDRERQRWRWELGGAEVLIHPDSQLIGSSLRESAFRSVHALHALGIHRANRPLPDFRNARLEAADCLLLVGPWTRIDRLRTLPHEFVVTRLPRERAEVPAAHRRMPVALAILATMVLLVVFDLVPLVVAAILAALAAVITRCLSMEQAYRSIHWSSIVLLAGMLPLADALERTGATDLFVRVLLDAFGQSHPRTMLTLIFFLTALVGLFLSNTASVVLVAPIAMCAARALDVSPYPFAVAVVIAASAVYSTPVSSPSLTLVVEPGRYRFLDFVKLGVPLLMLTWLVTLLITPLIFPFDSFDWPREAHTTDPASTEQPETRLEMESPRSD